MTGGGFLISRDDGFYERAAQLLINRGAIEANDELGGGVVQFSDYTGRLFTLYEKVPVGTEWEVTEGEVKTAPNVESPDMQLVNACPFECRWPDLVARLAHVIASAMIAPTWVLDGNGVIWKAEAVDPLVVRL